MSAPSDSKLSDRIPASLADLKARMAVVANRAAREAADITLVAVSKVHAADAITAALEAGQRVFGENRIQEAQQKWPALKAEYPDARLHLIGRLQTNKVRDAVELFDVIETVDRPKLAAKLADEMKRQDKTLSCFVQVNTGEEEQKAGVLPADADAFITECRETHGLTVAGLMCIPPQDEEPALHFAFLREIAMRNGVAGLSMGMSADFEIAIELGATHVRVGTAVFGERPKKTA